MLRELSANRKLGSLLLNYRIAQKCTQTIHAFGGHRADRKPAGSMSVIA
jgi:hypothetical protein